MKKRHKKSHNQKMRGADSDDEWATVPDVAEPPRKKDDAEQ